MLREMTAQPPIGLLVDQAMERRLRRAVPYMSFIAMNDWLELAFFDLESRAAAFIIDPTLLPDEHRSQTMRRLGERRRVPIILYARVMTPELAGILLEAGRLGISRLLLHEMVDDAEVARSVLSNALHYESPLTS